MPDEPAQSYLQVTGIGGTAVIGGVGCCMGLKLVGGAVLFGGLAATIGLSTEQITFVVGGGGGLLLAVLRFSYRIFRSETPT